jgi:hypothetical protein
MKRTAIVLIVGLGLAALSLWMARGGTDPTVEARDAYQQGDYARAVRAYQTAAAECADLGALAANQAAALYRLDHYNDADGRYRLAETSDDELRAARAAYDRGNCALRRAIPPDGKIDMAMLDRAAEQFRSCLGRESHAGEADSVFADARHNLELTKLLRNPSAPDAKASENAKQDDDKGDPQHAAGKEKDESESAKGDEGAGQQSPATGQENPKPISSLAHMVAKKYDEDYLCPDCKRELEQLAAAKQNGEKSNNDQTSHQADEKGTSASRSENDPRTEDGKAATDDKNDAQSKDKDASQAKSPQKEQKSEAGEQKSKDHAKSAQAQDKENQDGEWKEQPKKQQGKAPT